MSQILDAARNYFFNCCSLDTQEVAIPTKVSNSDPETLLEKIRTIETQKLDNELKASKPRFEKIQELICRILAYTMRDQSRINQHYIFQNGLEIQLHAKDVHGTFGPYKVVVITAVSSVIGIGAGIAGLTPLAPNWIAPATAQVLAANAQSMGTASTGIQSIGQTFGEGYQGKRMIYQVLLDNAKDSRSQEQDRLRESNQLRSSCSQSIQQAIENICRAVQSVLA